MGRVQCQLTFISVMFSAAIVPYDMSAPSLIHGFHVLAITPISSLVNISNERLANTPSSSLLGKTSISVCNRGFADKDC